MCKYEVYTFPKLKDIKLSKEDKEWIYKTSENLEIFPTGKILKFWWLREKRYKNKRLYFIIDEKTKRILLIDFDSKKKQQRIINYICSKKEGLFNYLRNPS